MEISSEGPFIEERLTRRQRLDRIPVLSVRLIIPLFFRLFEVERFGIAQHSAEEAADSADTRTSERYRPADCHGSCERRRQGPSVRHVRDRISPQLEPNEAYSRLARILSRAALSVRQGLRTLPRSGKPIASGIHSAIWETESSRSIKINIAIHQPAVQLYGLNRFAIV